MAEVSGKATVKDILVDSRIKQVLAMHVDSNQLIQSLDAISGFYLTNTVDSRRALRHDLEGKNLLLARKFLTEFDFIRERIEQVSDLSDKLQQACTAIAVRVSNADENMTSFMSKATELEQRRQALSAQAEEISSFLQRFQMSGGEIDVLCRAPLDDPR